MSRADLGATETMRLTHAEEHRLYETDRNTWARYVAPRWAEMLKKAEPEGKKELWALACPELQAALRALAKQTKEAA